MTPDEIAKLIDDRIENKYRSLIAGRFFRAKVTSVRAVGKIFLVSFTRPNSTVIEQDRALCVTPGYQPLAGDDVECMYRDENTIYCLWPVTGAFRHYHATAAAAAVTTAAAAVANIGSITVPAQGFPYRMMVQWENGAISQTVTNDAFDMFLGTVSASVAGVIRKSRISVPTAGVFNSGHVKAEIDVPGGGAQTLYGNLVRVVGTGTMATVADGSLNSFEVNTEPL